MGQILATAQAQFPKGANKRVTIERAWRPSEGELRPALNGPEGWSKVGLPATYEVVRQLRDAGYTWVNLYAGGTRWPFKDVQISNLI